MNLRIQLLLFVLSIVLGSCIHNKIPDVKATYLHIAHTRTKSNPDMDSFIESLDYRKYDMLWLGGDMAESTSEDDQTMSHIDSILDLGNKNTLWSLGNHDYSDLQRVEAYTKRAPYYAYHKNGITFIVLDTQDSLSSILGLQKELFDQVTDTIKESSHLVILHHKLIWMLNNSVLDPKIDNVANAGLGKHLYNLNPNNFYSAIYPKLLEVKQRGITVICIGGDIGYKVSEFEYEQDGIYFLASGIDYRSDGQKALLFHHDVTNKLLTWEFELLTEL